MTTHAPTRNGFAAGIAKHKLGMFLSAAIFAWGVTTSADAAITNTATATANAGAVVITATASESVDLVNEVATVTIDKQATVNDGGDGTADAGDTVTYTFNVKNTGTVTLTNVTVADTLAIPGGEILVADDVPPFTSVDSGINASWDLLAPGETFRMTATYIITPADVANASIVNSATANATTVGGSSVNASDSVTTFLNYAPGISLDKIATLQDGGDGVQAGDTIDYTFNVTNTGNVPLTNVNVSDPLVNMAALAGRAQMMAALDAAQSGADPIATASFNPAQAFEGERLIYAPVATSKAALYQPGLEIPQLPVALAVTRKMVLLSGDMNKLKAGDQVGIYFDLINAGEGPISNIEVTQVNAEAFGGALDILAPNSRDNASIIFTRTLTAEDISNGMIVDDAAVHFTTRGRTHVVDIIDVMPLGDMAAINELATASILPANVASLAPGVTATFTATHILTQADVDAGVVNNSATAEGTDPLNTDHQSSDSTTTTLPAAADIAVLKVGTLNLGPDSALTVGDTISYTFAVRNIGNVTLTGITLADPLPGIVVSGGPIATLAPGAVNNSTFTATYAITQADIDAEEVRNQAEATGILPDNSTTSDLSDPADELADAETVVPLAVTKKITVLKTVPSLPTLPFNDANSNGLADAGEVVTFTMTVTNSGNVSLNNVHVIDQDPLVSVTPAPPTGLTLLPAASTAFTGLYTLTQADVDAGFILNTADANGSDADGNIITDQSHPTDVNGAGPTRVELPATPAIALLKRQSGFNDLNSNTVIDLGDEITYEFDVVNTGNVTLTNVVITDPNADIGSITGAVPSLAPGVTLTNAITALHTVTAADMLAGEVVNSATATGDLPTTGTISDLSDTSDLTEDDPTITPITTRPAIALKKIAIGIADTNASSAADAGDTVSFRFEVKNTGNVDLTNVTVSDLVGGVTLVGLPIPLLEAGDTDTTTFTATYVLQPADVTAGEFRNRAQASGTAPDTTVVIDQSDANSFTEDGDTVIAIGSQPAVALIKRVDRIEDVNGNATNDVGDRIHYRFEVTNTGNTVLTNVAVEDTNATMSGGPLAILAVGATNTTTFTAIHIITQADLNAGTVENQAKVLADGPTPAAGLPVEVEDQSDESDTAGNDPTFASLAQNPKIAVVKTIKSVSDKNGNGLTDIGDVINYAFAVHNTGNVTLTNIIITDPNGVMEGGPLASLAPGKINSTTFTATHVITNADAEAEQVVNQATVSATSPAGGAVSDLSDDASPSGSNPTIIKVAAPKPVLTKVAAKSEVRRGERLSYIITASNLRTGPYDITDIMPPGYDFVKGSATINGVAAKPVEVGNVLTFAAITPNAEGRVSIKLQLLASTTIATGKFINRAQLIFTANGDVLTTAKAEATVKEEHVFDCGEIIGRVFDDKNGNGYQDKGELGLAGVRIATVNGVLITTDKNGLFHVSCADIPNAQIGSNFIMKLDTRTLPTGYDLTTENPRVVRLTRGKITKLNFGVTKNTDLELELKRDAFSGGISLYPQWSDGLDRLITLLEQGRGGLSIVYRCGQYAPIADERVAAVRKLVERRWADAGHNQRLKISTRVECGK